MSKEYVGKGKTFGKFEQVKIGLKLADLKANDRGWVNLVVAKMKEPDKYGNTHMVYVDDYDPKKKEEEPW